MSVVQSKVRLWSLLLLLLSDLSQMDTHEPALSAPPASICKDLTQGGQADGRRPQSCPAQEAPGVADGSIRTEVRTVWRNIRDASFSEHFFSWSRERMPGEGGGAMEWTTMRSAAREGHQYSVITCPQQGSPPVCDMDQLCSMLRALRSMAPTVRSERRCRSARTEAVGTLSCVPRAVW